MALIFVLHILARVNKNNTQLIDGISYKWNNESRMNQMYQERIIGIGLNIRNIINKLKANKPTTCKLPKPPPATPSIHRNIARQLSAILFKYNYSKHVDILYNILNILSKQGNSPDIFKYFGIGDCIMYILAIFTSV